MTTAGEVGHRWQRHRGRWRCRATGVARASTRGGTLESDPAVRPRATAGPTNPSGRPVGPTGHGTDPIRRGRMARVGTAPAMAILVGVLCVFGLVMVGSASPIISLSLYGSPWAILIRQAMYMGVGACALLLFARIDYRKWRKIRGALVVVTMGLLVVVLVPHLGVSAGGSSRWIGFGHAPAAAVGADEAGAGRVRRRPADPAGRPPPTRRRSSCPVLAVLGISGVLILKQPDMGTALVLACIAFGILFMGGVPMGPILKLLAAFAALAVIVGLADPYRRDRILSFLNPGANKSGTGYQVWQSLIGLGSGHIFGLGLGGGREKYGTLPNAHTDFIFSVVGEELGLIGAVALLGLFFALAWFGLRAAIAGAGPVRQSAGRRHHHLDHQPGGHQHRRGDRGAPGHRDPAAVHLLRWLVPHHHHGRIRHPDQHRRSRALGAAPTGFGGGRPPGERPSGTP